MSSLINKRVLLGVTGGIAAYKSAEIIRRLQDAGADVRVVMTKGAQEFITPLTLQALSGKPVHMDLLDPKAEAAMGHIELARWADIIVVAPASANFIAKLATGEGSDLLSTLCLATNARLAIAPAMNQGMWRSEATQENISRLSQRGIAIFGPASGEQACGDIGPGRMIEPAMVVDYVAAEFQSGQLAGHKVVITAGPTREAIDPVRYISNHSSGKMGYALAEACAEAGAHVILVSGPVTIAAPERVTVVSVLSAQEMHDAVFEQLNDCTLFIAAAAVADYRPASVANEKIKKGNDDHFVLNMVKTPDIVASVTAQPNKPFTVGFAAETQALLANAKAKLERKKLDLIIANDVADATIGFNSDDNAVTVLSAHRQESLSMRSKAQLARDLVTIIADDLGAHTSRTTTA